MFTVFILNFHSNLLILFDVDCWKGKEATPIGLYFSVVVLCFLFMVLLKAVALYPFCLNVVLKCWISTLKRSVSHVKCSQYYMFCNGWWCDFSWRQRSVWVSFLYTECTSEPTGFSVTKVSRNNSNPSVSISIVNLIFVCILLRCWNFCSSSIPRGQITNISSTYLYQ